MDWILEPYQTDELPTEPDFTNPGWTPEQDPQDDSLDEAILRFCAHKPLRERFV